MPKRYEVYSHSVPGLRFFDNRREAADYVLAQGEGAHAAGLVRGSETVESMTFSYEPCVSTKAALRDFLEDDTVATVWTTNGATIFTITRR